MEIIKIRDKKTIRELNLAPSVMTAGFFDGVHLGHQFLLKEAKKKATRMGLPLVVLTFWPYPKQFYSQVTQPYPVLTTLADKTALFAKMGVDLVLEVVFNAQIQVMKPQEFVDCYLKAAHIQHFIAGVDFTYGKKELADMNHLPIYAQAAFTISQVPFSTRDNQKISSSRVRQAITNHDLEQAQQLLGRPYCTKGRVIAGEQIGRTIGFPTANMDNQDHYLLPAPGVYFSQINIKNQLYWGITSLGNKPTFNGKSQFLETYILDFSDNIYGEEISLIWYHFERPQIKFDSQAALINEITHDKANLRGYLKTQ